jgi:hypothetical protein
MSDAFSPLAGISRRRLEVRILAPLFLYSSATQEFNRGTPGVVQRGGRVQKRAFETKSIDPARALATQCVMMLA